MTAHVGSWEAHTDGAWLFGSAARGDGDEASDIDVLILRPEPVDESVWAAQVEQFATAVTTWTGNRCEVVEYTADDFTEMMGRAEDRLAVGLRADAVALTPTPLPRRTPTRARR